MIKNVVYRYLGRNGTITTPILLEGVTPIVMYRLIADDKQLLTDGTRYTTMIDVFEDEVDNWREIPQKQNDDQASLS